MRNSAIAFIQSTVLHLSIAWMVSCTLNLAMAATSGVMAFSLSQQLVDKPRLAGFGQMRFLGLSIYDVRLWVGSEFDAHAFASYPFALELTYHRAFTSQAIAQRSIQEIERQGEVSPELLRQWTVRLTQWLPDVKAGDVLTGLYLPGQGMQLWRGDEAIGAIDDPELARYFFGIWLSPQTSEPNLRNALLAHTKKSAP